MEEGIRYRGKQYTQREIDEVREVVAAYQDRSRCFISQELCRQWNWRQPNGLLKDMLCRSLLLKLETHGFIELPPRRPHPPNPLLVRPRPKVVAVDETPLEEKLEDLKPIQLLQVRATPLAQLYESLIEQYHYLRYTRPVGEHLEYIAFSRGRPLACLGWCSAPRHIGSRDRYIGWTKEQRLGNLCRIVINTRFLILPFVHVPRLASHLLGLNARRISHDWEKVYCHDVVWLETFIDPERGFTGTCYKASNWHLLGSTTGRGKNDQTGRANRSLKWVFGYPLRKDFRKVLCA